MDNTLSKLASKIDQETFKKLHEEMSFADYLEELKNKPKLARTAYQTIYDMILSKGTEKIKRYRKTYIHYNFFDNPDIPIFGLHETLHQIVQFFKGAAGAYGPERRFLLLHGPVGSSKSTILRLLKRGLEKYSLEETGAWYTFKWVNLPTEGDDGLFVRPEDESAMHQDPLMLVPIAQRMVFFDELNQILLEQVPEKDRETHYRLWTEGELDPRSKKFMEELRVRYDGDWEKVVTDHVRVIRKTYSEADRMGIATFQPKDEKNQDSTELTGDINWGLLPHFGSDSDSRAFNFDGEFCFPAGSLVRMGDGSEKPIEEVVDDDEVITHTGHKRKVLTTFYRKYTGQMIKINLVGFDFPITMTKDHPVATIAGRCSWRWQPGDLVWKKAEDLTEDDRVIISWNKDISKRPILDLLEIEGFQLLENGEIKIPYTEHKNSLSQYVQVSPSFARFIGLYLAEGGCTKKKAHFYFSAKEEYLANEVISLAKGLFGAIGSWRKVNARKSAIIVEFNNVNLVRVLKHLVPGNVYSKRVPPLFFGQDEQVKSALLLGWLDGDGYVKVCKKSSRRVRIVGVTASENLARDMSVIALSCGMVAATYSRPQYKQSKKSYSVALSGKKTLNKIPVLAAEAKQEGIKLWEKDNNRIDFGYVRKIKSIESQEVFDLQVYDFEVEEDHSFLVNDIVVHNCVGNRGLIEFIEVLKLAKEFLYDLLGASQEHQIKPKKFPQISLDTILAGHSNNPEYEKLKNDQTMEALRDRTVKIDVPYLLSQTDELKVLEHYYGPGKVKQHIAPHTLEIAALWSVLTRLQDDKDGKLTLVEKAKLYDGKSLHGWTEDSVKELRDKYPDEGMHGGVSCRYTQDKISNCLSSHFEYINCFMVLNELKIGIEHQSLFNNEEDKARYITCIDYARKELDEILKKEVQEALVGDENAIQRLCSNYIDNVMAYLNTTKIENKFTGEWVESDERLMRSVEEKINIPEVGSEDFRRMLAAFIGNLAHEGKQFKWDSNPQLKKALEAKLFEDTKDHIKLSALDIQGASVVDPDIQEKIDAIKQRLIDNYGYNKQSATDVLAHVGSIFARGDVAEGE